MTETKGAEDRTSRARSFIGKWVSIGCSFFVIYALATMALQDLQLLSLFLAFSLAVGFVHYPLNPKRPGSLPLLVLDLILAALGFSFSLYIYFDYWEFIFRVGDPTHWDMFFGIVSIVLIFELTRRVVGWSLLIIAFAFLDYAFFGQHLPSPFSHKGYDLQRIATTLFMSKNGLFGVPMRVTTYFIYLFVAFGAFYETCGGTAFFVDLASSLFGKLRGGPAKVSVAVSGMMGTISGSAVANTVTTGTLTIPLMKRIGFEPRVAGAVEATASTGGQLMPPVMGAAAFIMAEYLGIAYIEVCKAAVIPAVLYFIAIYSVVHFYSLKIGIKGLSESEIPSAKSVFRDKWMFTVPLIVLIGILVVGYSPRIAVLYSLLATVVMSFFRKESRMMPTKIFDALAKTGYNCVMVVGACATAGIVIGVVLLTGMGGKITALVITLSAGSLVIALPIVMLASILFGMGLPTVVCYVLLAATVAPSLIDLGVTPMAAHLYIFYFGMLCMVTPPVSFAAYAGAAIAKADPMKTGWTAWIFALAGFLLPYMFVYNNSLLLMGSVMNILFAVLTSMIGVICLGAGIIGYVLKETPAHERILLFAAALLLIKPGLLTDIGGFLCVLLIVILQVKKQAPAVSDQTAP
ncbi:MAG: TRAP transporter permease [Deltaproteobacteria bacterium]|nr:MAG: TRAP transporter permease [Deltaproteobacteria bacterium]